jgi:hypothetical protein
MKIEGWGTIPTSNLEIKGGLSLIEKSRVYIHGCVAIL